jgi:hypothetical protein
MFDVEEFIAIDVEEFIAVGIAICVAVTIITPSAALHCGASSVAQTSSPLPSHPPSNQNQTLNSITITAVATSTSTPPSSTLLLCSLLPYGLPPMTFNHSIVTIRINNFNRRTKNRVTIHHPHGQHTRASCQYGPTTAAVAFAPKCEHGHSTHWHSRRTPSMITRTGSFLE